MTSLFFDHALLPQGWASDVAVDIADGFIRNIAPGAARTRRERIAGIALPGLANIHSHAFQRAMAGLAEMRGPANDSFWTWRQVMYRFLERLTPEDVEAIAAFAYMQMLEAGFTAVAEFHYLHHDPVGRPYADLAEMSGRIASAAAESGIGLTLLPSLYAHSTFGGAPPLPEQRRFLNDRERFLRLVEGAEKAVAMVPDAALGIAPHSLRAVTPDLLREVIAAAPPGPIHIHAAEQLKEVEDCVAWSGRRPVEWLLDEMSLDRRWCVVHATHMTEAETRGLAASGAVAGLCPLTEANLGDGIFDAVRFLTAGGAFGIGTDSNIEITASGELKQLEYAQRLKWRARNVLALKEGASTGRRLYEIALRGGSQASGRRIGGLSVGNRADIVVLEGTHPDLASIGGDRWLDAYLFVAGRSAVKTIIVGGRAVVEQGRHRARDRITARYAAALTRIAEA